MSVYQLLYEKDYPGWSEKLAPYKGAIKNISNIISKKEEQYGPYYPKKENLFMNPTPLFVSVGGRIQIARHPAVAFNYGHFLKNKM